MLACLERLLNRHAGYMRQVSEAMLCWYNSPIDAPSFTDRLETLLGSPKILGVAEKEIAPFTNGKGQERNDAFLGVRLEINQKVSARTKVHARERRITQKVLRREHNHVADLLLDSIGVCVLLEVALQTLLRDVSFYPCGVHTRARERKRLIGGIRRENLDLEPLASTVYLFRDEDRQRISFLAARTRGDPSAQIVACRPALYQRHNHALPQCFPSLGIAEKAGDIDQQVIGKRQRLLRLLSEHLRVLSQTQHADNAQAALNATQKCRLSISAKIMSSARPEQRVNLIHQLPLTIQIPFRRVFDERFGLFN